MTKELDQTVVAWWRERLMKGVGAEYNPDARPEVRHERHWCRMVANDAVFVSYRDFCEKHGLPALEREPFLACFEKLIGQHTFRRWPIPRKDLVTREWTEHEDNSKGVTARILRGLEECRTTFEEVTGESPRWPGHEDRECRRRDALTGCFAEVSVPLWWWWKLRRGETTHYYGDRVTVEWNRLPVLDDLIIDYIEFCKRHGLTRLPEADDPKERVPDVSFRSALLEVLPGDFLVPVEHEFRWPAYRRLPDFRHRGDRVEMRECIFLPRLEDCRTAFEQRAGLEPQDWDDSEEEVFQEEPDVASVAVWWRWKLGTGVTVPDETSPYGQNDRFWNRTAARDLLFRSYLQFCANRRCAPLDAGNFLEALQPLLVRRREDRVVAPLFRRAPQAAGDSALEIELVACFHLADLAESRTAFEASVGLGPLAWPEAEKPGVLRSGLDGMEPERVFRVWWHRLLCRAGVPREAELEEDGPFSDTWPLLRSEEAISANYRRFCSERGVPPADADTLAGWLYDFVPHPSRVRHISGPRRAALDLCNLLSAYRRTFEETVGRKMAWPLFRPTEVEPKWQNPLGMYGGIFWEEHWDEPRKDHWLE